MAPFIGVFTWACHCYGNDPGKARGPDTVFLLSVLCLSSIGLFKRIAV